MLVLGAGAARVVQGLLRLFAEHHLHASSRGPSLARFAIDCPIFHISRINVTMEGKLTYPTSSSLVPPGSSFFHFLWYDIPLKIISFDDKTHFQWNFQCTRLPCPISTVSQKCPFPTLKTPLGAALQIQPYVQISPQARSCAWTMPHRAALNPLSKSSRQGNLTMDN